MKAVTMYQLLDGSVTDGLDLAKSRARAAYNAKVGDIARSLWHVHDNQDFSTPTAIAAYLDGNHEQLRSMLALFADIELETEEQE